MNRKITLPRYRAYCIALVILSGLSFNLAADDVIEKVNGQCPSGYSNGPGKYCYNRNSLQTNKAIVKSRDECPTGYRNGAGQYCYESSSSRDVIEKVGNKCPSGYRDGRGHYCYK